MTLPDKIIHAVDSLPFRLRAEILCAVIDYMTSGQPPGEMCHEAQQKFLDLKPEIDRILRRRKRQAEYRRRKKLERQNKLAAAAPSQKPQPVETPVAHLSAAQSGPPRSQSPPEDCPDKLSILIGDEKRHTLLHGANSEKCKILASLTPAIRRICESYLRENNIPFRFPSAIPGHKIMQSPWDLR